jgi:hypothetical protein
MLFTVTKWPYGLNSMDTVIRSCHAALNLNLKKFEQLNAGVRESNAQAVRQK